MPAILSLILECGSSTAGSNAWLALRIRVSMSEMGSVMVVKKLGYQLAFVTPGIRPFRAPSRKVQREQANFRRDPWRRPLMEQRCTNRTGPASRGSFDKPA